MQLRHVTPQLFLLLFINFAQAQPSSSANPEENVAHPGAAVFQENCSSCHLAADAVGAGQIAPTLESLQTLRAASLEFAINEGVMYGQASVLSNEEKASIVDYLAAEEDDSWLLDRMCASGNRSVDLNQAVHLARFGVDAGSSRNMSREQAGLQTADMANLELR